MERRIGSIRNYYGCLYVKKDANNFYWGIENHDGTDWQEITEELYNNLISFEEHGTERYKTKFKLITNLAIACNCCYNSFYYGMSKL